MTQRHDWAGLAAVILSFGLAIGFAGALLWAASPFTDQISETGTNLLSVIGGGMVAVLAGYVSRQFDLEQREVRRSMTEERPQGEGVPRQADDPQAIYNEPKKNESAPESTPPVADSTAPTQSDSGAGMQGVATPAPVDDDGETDQKGSPDTTGT